MRRVPLGIATVLLCAALAACGGGSSNSLGGQASPPPPPPPPPADTSLVGFVKSLLAQTADTSEPAEVNDRTLTTSEDPAAFNDVTGS